MSDGLTRLMAQAIDGLRVNAVAFGERDGRPVVEKRRRALRTALFPGGNLFLRLSGSRIHMFTSASAWVEHELHCFALLHGPERACGPLDGGLFVERLPGRSLRELVIAGELDAAAMTAAGRELRRAHQLHCDRCDGPWSHGDPHLGNVLYDAEGGRAWLIDFETRHDPGQTAEARHADDLLVVLLELVGRCEAPGALAHALLAGYGAGLALEALRERLEVPRGLEAVLWSTRTHHMGRERLEGAVAELRGIVEGVGARGHAT